MPSAAKVGMLLVAFVALLLGSFAVLGRSIFTPPKDHYFTDLPDAGGVTEGTPVLLAGVTVGTVSKIRLINAKLARMTLELDHGTQVPAGSEVLIPTSLIGLGQNPVTIVPPEYLTGTLASPDVPLRGHKGSALDNLLPNSKDTVAELNKTMAAFRKLMEDEKLKSRVQALLTTSNQTLERFGNLAATFNTTLSQNQANISRAMTAAASAVQDVHRITLKVAQLLDEGKLQRNADQILTRVQTIEKHADDLVQNLNRLVNDPHLREPVNQIAANVQEITNTGKAIAQNTSDITKNGVEMSKNGVEISKNAAVISQKAIALTDKANTIAANAIDIENQFKGVLDKVGGFFNRSSGGPSLNLSSQIDLIRESDPGHWRTDITFANPLSDGTLYFGVYDAFEANKLTVQMGHPVSRALAYRYGIYASKPGLGVDYSFSNRLSIRSDAWDINHPRLDLRAKYDFGNGLTGWIGVDRVFHSNSPTIGIGIRH